VPEGLPALLRAYRVSQRAARTGFDWSDLQGVMEKVEEEWREFTEEVAGGDGEPVDPDRVATELGDIFFTLVNVARLAGFHPETALTRSVQKFQRRFRQMERAVAGRGRRLEDLSREELDREWEAAKTAVEG
jgi:uncharacterized protein YabN with tetrapyrrole methylase and pyrophosphatase domain